MAEGAEQPIAYRPLRVWATVGEAFGIWIVNWGLWLKLSIVPCVILIGLFAVAPSFQPDPGSAGAEERELTDLTFLMTSLVVLFLAEVPLVTAWHRVVLTREDTKSLRYLTGRREWRYLVDASMISFYFLLCLVIVGVVFGSVLFIAFGEGLDGASSLSHPIELAINSVGILVIFAILIRLMGHLCLKLPAAAIGASVSARAARSALKTNEWRLAGVVVLSLIPILLLDFVLQALLEDQDWVFGLEVLLTYIPALVFMPVLVGVLWITYRELVQTPEAAGTSTSPS
jgi:hypothetical protein